MNNGRGLELFNACSLGCSCSFQISAEESQAELLQLCTANHRLCRVGIDLFCSIMSKVVLSSRPRVRNNVDNSMVGR